MLYQAGSQVEMRAGRKEHGSSASSLLIIKYIIILTFVACTACENTFTHYKVYTTGGSVQRNNFFQSYVQSTRYKVYARSGSVQ